MHEIRLGLVIAVFALAAGCNKTSGSSPGTPCESGAECSSGSCVAGVCDSRGDDDDDNDDINCTEDTDNDGFCSCCRLGTDCNEGDPEINPAMSEECDGVDNDCDGVADESNCQVQSVGTLPDDNGFSEGEVGPGLTTGEDGGLTLTTALSATDYAWPSNDVEGTVSRIDTILNVEVGRYPSVIRVIDADPSSPGALPSVPDWDSGCNRPSRSTVDLAGNAYVANRAHKPDENGCSGDFTSQGSITKIGFYDEVTCTGDDLGFCECQDRNSNGTIETSRDVNGDGSISLSATGADQEYFGYDDECVLWTAKVGDNNSNPRAMALDANGCIWVGDWEDLKFYHLDPVDGGLGCRQTTGTAPSTIDVAGEPYGAVIDSQGLLWYVNDSGTGDIQSINTLTGAVSAVENGSDTGGYGITIDRKNRVWLASWNDSEGGGTVARYEPQTDTWTSFSAGLGGSWTGRGVTATPAGITTTGEGVVWATFHGTGSVSRLVALNDDTGEVWDTVDLTTECGALRGIGVGMGTGGTVWVVNQTTDDVCAYDPSTLNTVAVPIGNAPYTYSDFTGNLLRTFTSPQGVYRFVVEGCPAGEQTFWTEVNWEGDTPGQTSLVVAVRSGDTSSEVLSSEFVATQTQPPSNRLDLRPLQITDNFLQVSVTFNADDDENVPTLLGIDIAKTCSGSEL